MSGMADLIVFLRIINRCCLNHIQYFNYFKNVSLFETVNVLLNAYKNFKSFFNLPCRLFGKFCKMPNNELYLLGGIGFKGQDSKHKFTSLSDIDVYNIKQHKWEHIGDLNLAR